jgi:CrcB protein
MYYTPAGGHGSAIIRLPRIGFRPRGGLVMAGRMIPTLVIALGGALGSVARYWTGLAAAAIWGNDFPWGTLLINVVGSFIIGWFGIISLGTGAWPASNTIRLFVLVGVCGGFTTFSSFSLQTFELMRGGNWPGAIANVLLSVGLCLLAVSLGVWVAGLARPLTPP